MGQQGSVQGVSRAVYGGSAGQSLLCVSVGQCTVGQHVIVQGVSRAVHCGSPGQCTKGQ